MRHDPDVQQALHHYQLGLLRMPVSGRTGELLGRGTGSSLEFQEYREYMPGDDVRHLDWAAYARTDALMVRLFREEVSPRMEVLLDASRSMTTGGEAKPHRARQLTALLGLLSGRLGGQPRIVPLDDRRPLSPLGQEGLALLAELPFDGRSSLADLLEGHLVPLQRQTVRVVISDFLFPHDPDALVRRLAGGAGVLWLVQLLNAWEADPSPSGGRKFIDAETGDELDLLVDREAVDRYRERLGRLQQELARSCRRMHAEFVVLVAERGLPALCRDELCAAGLLRPA